MTPYKQGFIDKCAELEIDPAKLIKFSQEVEEVKKKKKRKSMHPALKALIGAGVLGGGAYAGYKLAPEGVKDRLRSILAHLNPRHKEITDPGGMHENLDAGEIAARLKEDLKPTDTGDRHLEETMPRRLLDLFKPNYSDPGGKHEYPLTAEELSREPEALITDPFGAHRNLDSEAILSRLKQDLEPTDLGGRHIKMDDSNPLGLPE
jgi:hypothetical protein